MRRVDLNCDMGELPEMLANGSQEALMKFVTSANVACGGHAGDEEMMQATIEQAMRHGVAVGAHPGYEDRENFGRVELQLTPEEIRNSVYRQLITLALVAGKCGARAAGVRLCTKDVVMVGLAGSVMLEEFRAAGFSVAAEAFADRRYEKDGSLRARKFRDALLDAPQKAAEQAVRIVEGQGVLTREGTEVVMEAQTICIHGDTPGAERIAETVRRALEGAGVGVHALKA
jgi:UPF0271 protein